MKQNLQTRKPFLALATFLLFLLLPGLPGKAWAQDADTNWKDQLADANVGEAGTDVTVSADKKTYTVHTAKGLAWIAWVTDTGKTDTDSDPNFPAMNDARFENCTVVLADDINLSGHLWTPIGIMTYPFYGSFDGGGHRVTGMKIDMTASGEAAVGLFGSVYGRMAPCVIKNLGVEIVSVNLVSTSGITQAAGLVGRSESCTIEKCYVTGGPITVTNGRNNAQPLAGGIVGYDNRYTIIKNCYSTVDVTVSASGSSAAIGAGGIAGYSDGEYSYCYATGNIKGERTTADVLAVMAGGLVGDTRDAAFQNNLALGRKIEINDATSRFSGVGRIFGLEGATSQFNNYASSRVELYKETTLQPITTNNAKDHNGAVIWLETPLESILAKDNDGAWVFTDGNLPVLSGFAENTQPTLPKADHLETGALTLGSDALTLKYDADPAYWMYKKTADADGPLQRYADRHRHSPHNHCGGNCHRLEGCPAHLCQRGRHCRYDR